MFIVTRFHTTIRVSVLFAAPTVQQEISLRSFVLAKAVYWNTMHRFADTVRFRGTSCFSLRRCRCPSGNVLAFMQTASMSSIIVVGCHVPHQRHSSTLGARPRSGFATRLPNRNTSRLLGRGTVCVNWASEPCGRLGNESPDPLVRTCLSDVAQFSAWCCVRRALLCVPSPLASTSPCSLWRAANGARVLCHARSCVVPSLIVRERATSEDTCTHKDEARSEST